MKRRGGSLTGGTGDVNPQFFNMNLLQASANTTLSEEFPIPRQRSPLPGGKSQVMEILKIFWNINPYEALAAVTEVEQRVTGVISTTSFGTTDAVLSNPRAIAVMEMKQQGAFTAGGTYDHIGPTIFVQDLTDGAGHGVLVATDSLFLQVQAANRDNPEEIRVKILYRFKNVALEEYIGIVQSQQ